MLSTADNKIYSIQFNSYCSGFVKQIPLCVQFCLQAFDHGGKGYITEAELTDILQNAFGMNHVDVHNLFIQVDQDKDGKIKYGIYMFIH